MIIAASIRSFSSANRQWSWTGQNLVALLCLALLAGMVRWVVAGHALERLDDPDGYLMLARSLARGDGFTINGLPTAYRPPLYPLLLVPCVWWSAGPGIARSIAWLQIGLGVMTVILVADAGRRWGLSRLAVSLAALVAAVDPVLLVQTRAIMTETLAAMLVSLTLWGISIPGRIGAIFGGIGFGLAALCRPSLLPAAFISEGLCCLIGPGSRRDRVHNSVLMFAFTLSILTPWAVRNWLVLGSWIWTTTHGGYTLALANNAAYYGDVLHGPPGAVWSGPNQVAWIDSINQATVGRTEPEADFLLRHATIEFVCKHPGDFLQATRARLERFWGIMPAAAVYSWPLRWATAAWTVPLWGLFMIGLLQAKTWNWASLVAVVFIATLTLVHSVYWTDLRMRAPIVPALALIAASGLERLRTIR